MSTTIYHTHHIIPKYRCKEIGIDPDFPENIIRITRAEHAEAHYHRWLKHKDRRDLGAAVILTKGEIDGLDISGEKHPFYGRKHSEETKKKMSLAQSGEKHSHYGKVPWNKGKQHTAAARKKMSEAQSGEKHHMYGKKRSAATLEKMRKPRGPQKKTTCPHCLQTGGGSMMKRHHFSNCKEIAKES